MNLNLLFICNFLISISENRITPEYPNWLYWFGMFLPFILVFGYIFYLNLFQKDSDSPKLRTFLRSKKTIWCHIHLAFAAEMLHRELTQNKAKSIFIRKYMLKNYPHLNSEFHLYLADYSREFVDRNQMINWIKKENVSIEKRITLLTFLKDICLIDGEMIYDEYRFLLKIGQLLSVPDLEIKKITKDYIEQQKQRSKKINLTHTGVKSARRKALQVLELIEPYNKTELKSQYRKLVKLNHPDKLVAKDDFHLKSARERFIEIQEAYELLNAGF